LFSSNKNYNPSLEKFNIFDVEILENLHSSHGITLIKLYSLTEQFFGSHFD